MFGNVIRLNPFGLVVLLALVFFFIYVYMDSAGPPPTYETVSLKRLLSVGVEVAEIGGKEVRDARMGSDLKEKSKGKTKEGANDPLTDGDLRSHRAMTKALQAAFPNLRVISEEHDNHDNKPSDFVKSNYVSSGVIPSIEKVVKEDIKVPLNDITVWIDPLDATQEYTENLLDYVTTMVCVAIQGKPIMGIIHQPFSNRTVWAWIGHGISPDVEVAKKTASSATTIIVSRSHKGDVEKVAKEAFGADVQVVPAGGAGYKSLQVLQGNATAYIHVTNIKKWDVCAGNVILVAAGGRMTTLSGQLMWYGHKDPVLNEDGVLATMFTHSKYVEKMAKIKINSR